MHLKLGLSLAVALLLGAVSALAGCGGKEQGKLSPREEGMKETYEGNYQVKAVADGQVQGVGIYDNGSFRVVIEGTPRLVIHNQGTGENWQVDMAQKAYTNISYDQAIMKAGFMPHLTMKAYFELQQFWEGDQFRMDTSDGRSITASLGEYYLPVLWEAASKGAVFKSIAWEYSRVDDVSPDNFRLPEGVTPQS